jgi:hypothetical protein
VHILCVLGFYILCSAMARGDNFKNVISMVQGSPFQYQVSHDQMPPYHVYTQSLSAQRGFWQPFFGTLRSCIGLA